MLRVPLQMQRPSSIRISLYRGGDKEVAVLLAKSEEGNSFSDLARRERGENEANVSTAYGSACALFVRPYLYFCHSVTRLS